MLPQMMPLSWLVYFFLLFFMFFSFYLYINSYFLSLNYKSSGLFLKSDSNSLPW